jgi:hypothetical protein
MIGLTAFWPVSMGNKGLIQFSVRFEDAGTEIEGPPQVVTQDVPVFKSNLWLWVFEKESSSDASMQVRL